MGEQVKSWLGDGENAEVSAEQVTSALGQDQIAAMASKMGVSTDDAANTLKDALPSLLDKASAGGSIKEQFGSTDGLMNMAKNIKTGTEGINTKQRCSRDADIVRCSQGRHRPILVQSQRYLLACYRYIDLNLGATTKARCRAYRDLCVNDVNQTDLQLIRKAAYYCQPIGSARFRKQINEKYGLKPEQ